MPVGIFDMVLFRKTESSCCITKREYCGCNVHCEEERESVCEGGGAQM